METKVGRNDLCLCGSGKKYKKCCLNKGNVGPKAGAVPSPQELESIRQELMEENHQRRVRYLEPRGIYIDFVKPAIFQGKKIWAIGDRCYYNRPPNQTFHEFIISILYEKLGEPWRQEQLALEPDKQHFIFQCVYKYKEWRVKNAKASNRTGEIWGAKPDGWSKSLLSLAFDIASLVHIEHLPEKLLSRLKNRNEYQGARYEIAIAAIFARLNYKISFLDEEDTNKKHPEFIAEDRNTGEKIAVEAKSKHRKGIIHFGGIIEDFIQLIRGDIQRLYRHALQQNPEGMPFMVFIDLNSPQTKEQWENKKWFKDVKKFLAKSSATNKADNPDPCTAAVFTNYSYHYQTEKESLHGEYLLTIPLYPAYAIQNSVFFKRLNKALSSYGSVPNLDIEVLE